MNFDDPDFQNKLLAYQQETTDKIVNAFSPFSGLDIPIIIASLAIIERELRKSFPPAGSAADALVELFGSISVVGQKAAGPMS